MYLHISLLLSLRTLCCTVSQLGNSLFYSLSMAILHCYFIYLLSISFTVGRLLQSILNRLDTKLRKSGV